MLRSIYKAIDMKKCIESEGAKSPSALGYKRLRHHQWGPWQIKVRIEEFGRDCRS